METTNLDKNLSAILNDKYIVPLYQRNFAWGEEEISQLLQDVHDSFSKNKDGNYYIGSLVVLKRKNGDFEIIDGQQRLTAITLIAKILGFADGDKKEPNLFYDSRPEVESFFNSFYHTGTVENVTFDHKVEHLVNAVEFIKQAKLNPSDDKLTIETLENKDDFKKYFFEKVILVRVEIPEDTDVAAYFEIMNNRGEQLQKHEIIKAKLIDKIKKESGEHDKEKQAIFAKIWDACSQMDIRIQKLFDAEFRNCLFGENFDTLDLTKIENLSKANDENLKDFSIDEILKNSSKTETSSKEKEYQKDESIIDFPNFLMHIFKLEYNDDIPLNEKYLITEFNKIESQIENKNDTMNFIRKLLFYRTIFDRFIIKSVVSKKSEDGFRWSLEKPTKYESLDFKNTFEEQNKQERIVKCLSMLQVTFRTRIYKNWLQDVLSWFKDKQIEVNSEDYINFLEKWMFDYYTNLKIEIPKTEEGKEVKPYSSGTNTPHFLFNFIDYLYWVESKEKKNNIVNIDSVSDFDFKYRNSIEHHLSQSFSNDENKNFLDCLGNLCLVSKSANSRMNNEAPTGKADKTGKYYKENLPPKQKIMYDLTKSEWGKEQIKTHYNDIVDLLEKRGKILKDIK